MDNLYLKSVEALISRGTAASQSNDAASAIEWFEKATAAAPMSGLPQFLLGAEFAASGDMGKAEAAFANAVRLAPDLLVARYQLGLLQFSSGRPAMALLSWQPLLSLPDADPLPHFVRGFTALAKDKFAVALNHYRDGLACNLTNRAMAEDIEKIIAGILAISPGADAAAEPLQQFEDFQAHVLLSNYQQHGRAH